MSGWDNVKIEYKGQEYQVPPTQCFGLLAAIEEIMTPDGTKSALDMLANPHKTHLTKLARAYGAALRYAGCDVRDDEVYISIADDVMQGGTEAFLKMKSLGDALLLIFFPNWVQEDLGNSEGVDAEEAPTPIKTQKTSSDAA